MPRAIRHIYDEQPQAKMWDTFLYLESEPATLKLLTARYEQCGERAAQRLAYENTAPFIYYLKQAREYYRTAQTADRIVKPLVLYYGMMSLTKAYVLTLDPHYPNRTSLLRHGLSTRKRKKLNYRFRDDEIKVQKDGLLPHVLSLLGMTQGLEEKYKVWECLGHLPQLYNTYRQIVPRTVLYPIYIPRNSSTVTYVYMEDALLDHFHLRAEGFVHMLNRHNHRNAKGYFELKHDHSHEQYVTIVWKHPELDHVSQSGEGFQNTMILADATGHYFLRLSTERRLHLPEYIFHLMLMFHLGMLARYETERWGEIVFTFGSDELFLIHELLQQTERYYPNLLLNEMLDEQLIFKHP